MEKQLEEYIKENLIGETQITALEFVAFLRSNNIEFYKDNSSCWKDKIYYWLKFKNECVAFIAIKDPEEPKNLWTVWSDDSKAFETDISDYNIKTPLGNILIFAVIAVLAAVVNARLFSERNFPKFAVSHLG